MNRINKTANEIKKEIAPVFNAYQAYDERPIGGG